MKKIIYTIVLSCIMLSCNDWLDVRPLERVKEVEMFESEGGFRDALIGVYLKIRVDALYGETLSFEMLEHLVAHWDVGNDTKEEAFNQLDFSNEKTEFAISDAWRNYYSVMAHINNIINYADKNKDVFETEGMYELIKGEALALRAFVYFDLLRLFGPCPQNANANEDVFPYAKTISTEVHKMTNYANIVNHLNADFNMALALLEKVDPFVDKNHVFENSLFTLGREGRLNYYACLGLKARFDLWIGNNESACQNALKVIQAKKEDGTPVFRLGTLTDITVENDCSFYTEHLWSMAFKNINSKFMNKFESPSSLTKDLEQIRSLLFENNNYDIRWQLWEEQFHQLEEASFFRTHYTKFRSLSSTSAGVPIVRLAEMYLIMAEASPSLNERIEYLKTFKQSRGIDVDIVSEADLNKELKMEWEREFYAEGQMFYQYKRWASSQMLWNVDATQITPEMYRFPVPQDEIIYH